MMSRARFPTDWRLGIVAPLRDRAESLLEARAKLEAGGDDGGGKREATLAVVRHDAGVQRLPDLLGVAARARTGAAPPWWYSDGPVHRRDAPKRRYPNLWG